MADSAITEFKGKHRVFSNFDMLHPFVVPELGKVKSVEHGFQAMKTNDSLKQREILAAESPAAAKRMGRKVDLISGWDTGARQAVMLYLLGQKFKLKTTPGKRLLLTNNVLLVEGNLWHDNYWGMCMCGRKACINGKNLLGEFLMAIRHHLLIERRMKLRKGN